MTGQGISLDEYYDMTPEQRAAYLAEMNGWGLEQQKKCAQIIRKSIKRGDKNEYKRKEKD